MAQTAFNPTKEESIQSPKRLLHSAVEFGVVDSTAEHRGQPFRGAEQIDVLPDEAGID